MPVALIGVGVSELSAGRLFGLLWLLAAVLLLLIYAMYARRPVVDRRTDSDRVDAEVAANAD